mgnify:CR=1 FL=1
MAPCGEEVFWVVTTEPLHFKVIFVLLKSSFDLSSFVFYFHDNWFAETGFRATGFQTLLLFSGIP